jgi:hypothetical protein
MYGLFSARAECTGSPISQREDRQGGLSHRARERLQAWVQLAPLDTDGVAMQSYMMQWAWDGRQRPATWRFNAHGALVCIKVSTSWRC